MGLPLLVLTQDTNNWSPFLKALVLSTYICKAWTGNNICSRCCWWACGDHLWDEGRIRFQCHPKVAWGELHTDGMNRQSPVSPLCWSHQIQQPEAQHICSLFPHNEVCQSGSEHVPFSADKQAKKVWGFNVSPKKAMLSLGVSTLFSLFTRKPISARCANKTPMCITASCSECTSRSQSFYNRL